MENKKGFEGIFNTLKARGKNTLEKYF